MIYYKVTNPNFLQDVKDYLDLSLSKEQIDEHINSITITKNLSPVEIRAGDLDMKEKLIAFIDRVEFIKHLNILSINAKKQRFRIDGNEVVGVDMDINALRLYLSLTCIDIFKSENSHKEQFIKTFENTTDNLKDLLVTHIKIRDLDGNETNELKDIAEFLYNVRNYYTHSGKRFHILENISVPLIQNLKTGTQNIKSMKFLILSENFSLIDTILLIAKSNVIKEFEW